MTAPRLILALSGLAFLGFGVAFLVSPVAMADLVGLPLTTPTATTEVRAMYGGLEIGLGVALLTLLGRRDHVATGLRVALCVFAGLAAGRLTGLLLDGLWQPIMWLLVAVEVVGAALVFWALQQVQTTPPPAGPPAATAAIPPPAPMP